MHARAAGVEREDRTGGWSDRTRQFEARRHTARHSKDTLAQIGQKRGSTSSTGTPTVVLEPPAYNGDKLVHCFEELPAQAAVFIARARGRSLVLKRERGEFNRRLIAATLRQPVPASRQVDPNQGRGVGANYKQRDERAKRPPRGRPKRRGRGRAG